MFERKKEKIIDTLNNHFNIHDIIPEVKNISDEDFIKIIELYEKKASVNGKDPWNYLYFEDLIIMEQALYEVIKDNEKYSDITSKVENLYEQELKRRLTKYVYEYGEKTDKTYMSSYATMPEYSMTYAEICAKRIQNEKKQGIENSLTTIEYDKIKKDFETAHIEFIEPNSTNIVENEKESISSQTDYLKGHLGDIFDSKVESTPNVGYNYGTIPRTPPVENVYGAEDNRKFNMEQMQYAQEILLKQRIQEEKERAEREIELMSLQQEINRIEIEKLDIQKRIKRISSETLGSFFAKQIAERFPNEYQSFQQIQEQVNGYKTNYIQITDLKEKFGKINEDLKFYQQALPSYESYYQAYKQLENERQKQNVEQSEKKRIYNLIYAEENARLKARRSLYTAYDLSSSKSIPEKYQGLTYEQVEQLINEEKEQERLDNLAREEREQLINKAIRKNLGVAEDYKLSDVQIKNLRVDFDRYSTEDLKQYLGIVSEQTMDQPNELNVQANQHSDIYEEMVQQLEDSSSKDKIIFSIIEKMYPDGVEYAPVNDIKRQLESYSLEQLEEIYNQYELQAQELNSGKMHR